MLAKGGMGPRYGSGWMGVTCNYFSFWDNLTCCFVFRCYWTNDIFLFWVVDHQKRDRKLALTQFCPKCSLDWLAIHRFKWFKLLHFHAIVSYAQMYMYLFKSKSLTCKACKLWCSCSGDVAPSSKHWTGSCFSDHAIDNCIALHPNFSARLLMSLALSYILRVSSSRSYKYKIIFHIMFT